MNSNFAFLPPAFKDLAEAARKAEGQIMGDPDELEAYTTVARIRTPWYGLEHLPVGSKLFLAPAAARFMAAEGTIRALEEKVLILSRDTTAPSAGMPVAPAAPPTRKARSGAPSRR